ncbi:MAG TPA: hypothetical protein VF826_09350 [Chloroflexia bacterium]
MDLYYGTCGCSIHPQRQGRAYQAFAAYGAYFGFLAVFHNAQDADHTVRGKVDIFEGLVRFVDDLGKRERDGGAMGQEVA